jgi:NADPH:quinone reductase-like Zn-dependent oxidoreductase
MTAYPARMRRVVFDRFGAPGEVLRIEEVAAPQPGSGEVRVAITHRPIHPADLMLIRGAYPALPPLPATPGIEGVGRVDAVGDGMDAALAGRRSCPMAWCS